MNHFQHALHVDLHCSMSSVVPRRTGSTSVVFTRSLLIRLCNCCSSFGKGFLYESV